MTLDSALKTRDKLRKKWQSDFDQWAVLMPESAKKKLAKVVKIIDREMKTPNPPKTMLTRTQQQIDEENTAVQAQVEREFPKPISGFECDGDRQHWLDMRDARFLELCRELPVA